jgi:hypothetical protein
MGVQFYKGAKLASQFWLRKPQKINWTKLQCAGAKYCIAPALTTVMRKARNVVMRKARNIVLRRRELL